MIWLTKVILLTFTNKATRISSHVGALVSMAIKVLPYHGFYTLSTLDWM